jgi:hypothetical protein
LGFERSDLGEPAEMPRLLAEGCRQECLERIPGQLRSNRPASHADDIHVIIFDALAGGEMVTD